MKHSKNCYLCPKWETMISIESIRQLALSLPETDEIDHFRMPAFRVKQKIFLTVNQPEGRCTLRLSKELQSIFTAVGHGAVYPVPNKWGTAYGWTHLDLEKAPWELFEDALKMAWREVAPPKFAQKYPDLYDDGF